MSKPDPSTCQNMDQVRAEIDRLDDALVDLLIERWTYVDRAWQLKQNASEARVPWRIQQVVDRVTARADAAGMPTALVESLWRQLIGWGIQYEEEKIQKRDDS